LTQAATKMITSVVELSELPGNAFTKSLD